MSSQASFCSYCGKPTVADAAYCAFCGKELSTSAEAAAQATGLVGRAVAVADRASLDGRCAVILAGGGVMDISRVGRLVAEATRTPLPDVTRKMRTTKGFLATDLEAGEAVSLADRIEGEVGVRVLVIPEEACVSMPRAMRMRAVEIDGEGIHCQAYTWDQTEGLDASWEEVFLVSCGRLALEQVRESPREAPRAGNAFDTVPDLVTRRYNEFLIDIVLCPPWRRLRLDYNTAGYVFRAPADPESERERALGVLRECAINLQGHGRGVPMNRGVNCLAGGASDAEWQDLTFLSKLDFDSHTHWLIQLVRFGVGIPR